MAELVAVGQAVGVGSVEVDGPLDESIASSTGSRRAGWSGCSDAAAHVARLEAGDHEPSLTTLRRLDSSPGIAFHIDVTPERAQLSA
jgi:hypothetical protein